MNKKNKNQEKIQAALDRIEEGLATINTDEDWLKYLVFQSQFYNYSLLSSLREIVTFAMRRFRLESMDIILPFFPLVFVVWEEPDIGISGSSLQILKVLTVKLLKFKSPTPFVSLYRARIEPLSFPHKEHSSCWR